MDLKGVHAHVVRVQIAVDQTVVNQVAVDQVVAVQNKAVIT